MKERFNLIWNMILDMLAVYWIWILAIKYFPRLLPFNISLEIVAFFVLIMYVLKVIFTKTIKVKQSE